jgi:hypothetical protein
MRYCGAVFVHISVSRSRTLRRGEAEACWFDDGPPPAICALLAPILPHIHGTSDGIQNGRLSCILHACMHATPKKEEEKQNNMIST